MAMTCMSLKVRILRSENIKPAVSQFDILGDSIGAYRIWALGGQTRMAANE